MCSMRAWDPRPTCSEALATDLTLQADERQKLHAGRRVIQENTVQLAGRGPRTGLFHAPITHAKVLTLQDHGHPQRAQVGLNGIADLLRELLLNLQALGEYI